MPRISPTAHYTGEVWARHDLGPRELTSMTGRLFYQGLQPLMRLSSLFGGPTLEDFLLARHRIIDKLLAEAIDNGTVGQVIEIAAGMSPRGYQFTRRYARLTYIETDLTPMATRKRTALRRLGTLTPQHRIEPLDALRLEGPDSLSALAATLNPEQGLAVITEGLLNYLPAEQVRTLWGNVATTTDHFRHGLYLSDLHLAEDNSGTLETAFATALGGFVRGRTHMHHNDAAAAQSALRRAGFQAATLHQPLAFSADIPDTGSRGARTVRIIEAHTTRGPQ